MSCPTPQKKAFTLVEVLIVLVIISIMAGLLITVIDPVRQRQRAQDGTIVATANKIVAAVEAYNSALGAYPSCATLAAGEISNIAVTNACTAGSGSFSIGGLTYPTTGCDATTGYGTGSAGCVFRYGFDGTNACLGIRTHLPIDLNGDGTPNQYLIWSSTSGSIGDEGTSSCAL